MNPDWISRLLKVFDLTSGGGELPFEHNSPPTTICTSHLFYMFIQPVSILFYCTPAHHSIGNNTCYKRTHGTTSHIRWWIWASSEKYCSLDHRFSTFCIRRHLSLFGTGLFMLTSEMYFFMNIIQVRYFKLGTLDTYVVFISWGEKTFVFFIKKGKGERPRTERMFKRVAIM